MSLSPEQIAIRRTGITASDIRAIVGLDPYGVTRHDVYASKVLGVDRFKETEATELGDDLEPIALRLLAKKRNRHILRRDPKTLTVRHRERSAHIATPDAFLAEHAFREASELGEAKVVGFHNASGWGTEPDAIPDWALVQVTWQAYVTAIPVVLVGALIGTEVRTYRIERDEDLVGVLVEEADKFLRDHVTPRKPPAVDGTEGSGRMLRALFPRPTGPMVRASAEAEERAKAYFHWKHQVEVAEANLEGVKQALIAACGESEGIVGSTWRMKLGMRKGYTVDRQSYTVPEARTFDMREVKGARKPSAKGRAA
jgi:predicted phage-related endonuclease